ncbi:adenylate/guanylate cyclase domain-containing protein [Oceanibacterium hippocampi]|uniref:Adenylate cyclase 1 n=1 Tax=Oceanibacterium hippocampi TaxID=745714 RepID=A0A1Y5S4K7_9PROT|nr:adenylate/guanylate cyclase domain-containing protein [Oceanibacterium hippocampi]SLN31173.1 Adenylate cyclase 1 [Oceanibacterium hippocampi]
MVEPGPGDRVINVEWQQVVIKGHPPLKWMHRIFSRLPGPPRCKLCHNPFGGIGGKLCALINMRPSRKNPALCVLCCEGLPPGGAEVEIAVLFADIRDSTGLAHRLGPTAYAETLNRFYTIATEVLIPHDATIDKLIGDEVMAFFVPGFAGPDFKRVAVTAARELREALAGAGPEDGRLAVGIGLEAGPAYVGNVGAGGYVDFTAVGDPVNAAAHIQALARSGEILLGDGIYAAVADRYPDSPALTVTLKGHGPLTVHALG